MNSNEKETKKQPHIENIDKIGTDYTFKRKIVWQNVFGIVFIHFGALYGLYLIPSASISTIIFVLLWAVGSGLGITACAHRLYAHKTYKATFLLRCILVFLQTTSGQNSIFTWVRDHRLHHKYSDTDADPHNANRGFFFSHFGWLMSRKHPLVREKGRTINMNDLKADKVVMFQYKYYYHLVPFCLIGLPVGIPVVCWNETLENSLFIAFFFRYVLVLHITWLVNSAAHIYGYKPYDQTIKPKENGFVSLMTGGEGWHNYHHVFPWDYRASEFGKSYTFTTNVIDLCAKIGLAYDLKTVSKELLEKRVQKNGDLSLRTSHLHWTNIEDE